MPRAERARLARCAHTIGTFPLCLAVVEEVAMSTLKRRKWQRLAVPASDTSSSSPSSPELVTPSSPKVARPKRRKRRRLCVLSDSEVETSASSSSDSSGGDLSNLSESSLANSDLVETGSTETTEVEEEEQEEEESDEEDDERSLLKNYVLCYILVTTDLFFSQECLFGQRGSRGKGRALSDWQTVGSQH